jgi:enoyl-CoA hydratase
MSKVLYEVKGHVAIIRLNRPERINALDMDVWKLLGEYAERLAKEKDVRCAVLVGNGEKGFTAGLDLKGEFPILEILQEESESVKVQKLYEMVKEMRDVFTKIEEQPKPVIAGIHGYCLGGGVQLIACCDIRIASEDAKFALPEVQMGMFPDLGGTQRLPRIIGPGATKELIFTGKMIDAYEALRIHLVDRVVKRERLFDEVMSLAEEIARNAPIAVQNAKRAINNYMRFHLPDGLDYETRLSSVTLNSKDLLRGLASAFNKEARKFEGN